MMDNEQSLALHEVVEGMGYHSVEDFALVQAKEKLLQGITVCMKHVEHFEEKYKMGYADFYKNFHQLLQPLFEKEDDSAEWNAEIKQLHILQKRLSRLS